MSERKKDSLERDKSLKPSAKKESSAESQKSPSSAAPAKEAQKPVSQAPSEEKAEAPQPVQSGKSPEPADEKKQEASSSKKSEEGKPQDSAKKATAGSKGKVKLSGLFAFKMSMTSFYSEKGESVPVTALKYEPCFVSQIKSKDKESYSAVQLAFMPQKNKRCSKALIKHLSPAGFKEGARFVKEIRQTPPEGLKEGQAVDIESLAKGDLVKISSFSKGRGFSGVMKRWNFRGGRASHGSKSHRRTGSIGQHTEPARVFPGRKMPGRHGFKKVSRLKTPIVDVLPDEGIIFVKGPVPGARNTLVTLQKI